ncbi:MAG: MHYT domain-containing protein [Microvirga sp.]
MSVAGTHDTTLVALSILIATAASYTALDLAGRIRASSGWACHAWLATSAVAMGGGIWSMHFVAMLAFSMPGMDVSYDVPLTALSLIVAILVTGIGLHAVSREKATPKILLFSGCFVGLGIVAMHYTGMAAMRMGAHVDYDMLWVAISVLIALGAATVALWLAFQNTGLVQKLVAAVAMGLAISGMHYSGMQAAIFTAHSAAGHAHGDASLAQTALAAAVAGTTFLILFLALPPRCSTDASRSSPSARPPHCARARSAFEAFIAALPSPCIRSMAMRASSTSATPGSISSAIAARRRRAGP